MYSLFVWLPGKCKTVPLSSRRKAEVRENIRILSAELGNLHKAVLFRKPNCKELEAWKKHKRAGSIPPNSDCIDGEVVTVVHDFGSELADLNSAAVAANKTDLGVDTKFAVILESMVGS